MGLLDWLRARGAAAAPDSPEPELSKEALEDGRRAYNENYNFGYMNCGRGSSEIYTVVGTSEYQAALRVVAGAPRPWRHEWDRNLPAVLMPDADGGSVRVLMDGYTVGRLPDKVAAKVRPMLDQLAASQQLLVCAALLVGGDSGKMHGILIHIKPEIGRRWAKGTRPDDV